MALKLLIAGALPAVLLSLSKVLFMARQATGQGATVYGAASHFNWFFRNYRPEGPLAVLGPLVVTAVFAGFAIRGRRETGTTDRPAVVLVLAMTALYLATPKTLSGIYLVCVRLPAWVGVLSLLLVDARRLPRPLLIALLVLSAESLRETAVFHDRFQKAVAGLDDAIAGPRPGVHGYWAVGGMQILGSRHPYLMHLGQWWTAEKGGVGRNFFIDAEHHPIHLRPGQPLIPELGEATREDLLTFDEVLLFGDVPVPASLAGWKVEYRAGWWRRLARP